MLRQLGEGAGGAVWEAEDTDLARRVAVKFVSSDHEPGAGLVRLREEARRLVLAAHPNVVGLLGFDVTDAGRALMIMELVIGRSVAEEVYLHGPLLLRDARALMVQVSSAIQAVHHAGLLHLDLKPDNLLVVRGSEFRVKLIDFGIARSTRAREPDRNAALVDGTPQFMSPEQMTSCEELDERADDFALAVCAYHVLTGAMPFHGATIAELWVAISRGELTPATKHRAELPPAIDAFFTRALAYEKRDRFRDTGAMCAAFGAALAQPEPARVAEKAVGTVPPSRHVNALPGREGLWRTWLVAAVCLILVVLASAALVRGSASAAAGPNDERDDPDEMP